MLHAHKPEAYVTEQFLPRSPDDEFGSSGTASFFVRKGFAGPFFHSLSRLFRGLRSASEQAVGKSNIAGYTNPYGEPKHRLTIQQVMDYYSPFAERIRLSCEAG